MSKKNRGNRGYHSTVGNREYMTNLGRASGVQGLEETESALLWNRDPWDIPLYGLDESRSRQ